MPRRSIPGLGVLSLALGSITPAASQTDGHPAVADAHSANGQISALAWRGRGNSIPGIGSVTQ